MKARINPADFYQAVNGKKPFFPAWRKRLADALDVTESELFSDNLNEDISRINHLMKKINDEGKSIKAKSKNFKLENVLEVEISDIEANI